MKISIATEDILTEEAMVKVLSQKGGFDILHKLGKQGNGYLLSKLNNFNQLAITHKVLVVFDLDVKPSSVDFKKTLEGKVNNINENLNIVVSVREVESWLLADREGISKYFSVSKDKIDRDPDALFDPKEKIINLARQSKIGDIKRGLPPKVGAASKIGLSYNRILVSFIQEKWDFLNAINNSPSLRNLVNLLDEFSAQNR